MAIEVNVPGIPGPIVVEGVASEATMQEILKSIDKNGREEAKARKDAEAGSGSGADTGGVEEVNETAGKAGRALGLLTAHVGYASGAFVKLGEVSTQVIDHFANVGDSVESAAATFNGIPVVGTAFAAVASATTRAADSFNQVTASGASFGGSVNNMARSASQAGMTLDNFAGLIAENGEGMLAFGTTTGEGAARFARLSKEVRSTGSDLFALGFSTKDINEGLGTFGKQIRMQGLQRGMTDRELIEGSQQYLKEMDKLAKITGETRKEKEAEREQLLADAQFQASMAGMQKDVRDSFLNTVQALPKGMQDFTKDILATGTATQEENQKLLAQMPQTGALITQFHAKMQRGEKITAQEQERLRNLMMQEGPAALERLKFAGAASEELAPLVNALASTLGMNADAVAGATKAQEEAAGGTDGVNEELNKSREQLAKITNQFTMTLVESGILDEMLGTFTALADFVGNNVVPIFNVFTDLIQNYAYPVFKGAMDILNAFVMPSLMKLGDFVIGTVVPALGELFSIASAVLVPVLGFLGGIIADYVLPAFMTIGGIIADHIAPIFAGLAAAGIAYAGILAKQQLATAMQTAATYGGVIPALKAFAMSAFKSGKAALLSAGPFLAVGLAVAALTKILYKNGFSIGGIFEMLGDMFKRLVLNIENIAFRIQNSGFAKMLGLGMSDDEAKKRREDLHNRGKELDQRAEDRAAARKERAAQRTGEGEEVAATDSNTTRTYRVNGKEVSEEEYKASQAQMAQTKSGMDAAMDQGIAGNANLPSTPAGPTIPDLEMPETATPEVADVDQQTPSTTPAQEATETGASGVNNISSLIALMQQNNKLLSRQISATEALSGDLYKAIG